MRLGGIERRVGGGVLLVLEKREAEVEERKEDRRSEGYEVVEKEGEELEVKGRAHEERTQERRKL